MSDAHGRAGIGVGTDRVIERVAEVVAWRDALPANERPEIEIGVSIAFDCTISGPEARSPRT